MQTQQDEQDRPTAPREWTLAQIQQALSRNLPPKMVKFLEKTNKKTGKMTKVPYIPWHTANRILDKYAPGWTWEITNLQTTNGSLFLTGRLTIPTSEGNIYREATGTESLNCSSYGDPSSNAESMAFRRCAAKFGLGLYLYIKK